MSFVREKNAASKGPLFCGANPICSKIVVVLAKFSPAHRYLFVSWATAKVA